MTTLLEMGFEANETRLSNEPHGLFGAGCVNFEGPDEGHASMAMASSK